MLNIAPRDSVKVHPYVGNIRGIWNYKRKKKKKLKIYFLSSEPWADPFFLSLDLRGWWGYTMGPTFLKSELFIMGYDKNSLEFTKLHITWDASSLVLIFPWRGRQRGLLMDCYCGSSSHGMLHRSLTTKKTRFAYSLLTLPFLVDGWSVQDRE